MKPTHSKAWESLVKQSPRNDYCVYVDYRADTMEPIYVGQGRYMVRNRYQKRENQIWMALYRTVGIVTEIVEAGVQQWYAEELEREWIMRIGKERLINKGYGGRGGFTGVFSSATGNRIRSRVMKEVWATTNQADKIRAGKARQAAASKGKSVDIMTSIRCKETGVIFQTQMAAANAMGLSQGNLSRHLRGLASCVNGFHFERVENTVRVRAKRVRCVETGVIYPSHYAAGKAMGKCGSYIQAVTTGICETSCGYHWELVD